MIFNFECSGVKVLDPETEEGRDLGAVELVEKSNVPDFIECLLDVDKDGSDFGVNVECAEAIVDKSKNLALGLSAVSESGLGVGYQIAVVDPLVEPCEYDSPKKLGKG